MSEVRTWRSSKASIAYVGSLPRIRATTHERSERLDRVEGELLRLRSRAEIETTLAREFRCSTRTIRRDVEAVRARWASETPDPARSERRNLMRRSLDDAYARAATRTRVVRRGNGEAVIDAQTGAPLTEDVPDFAAMTRIARLLIDLDGLNEPAPKGVQNDARDPLPAVAHDVAETASRAALEAFLKRTAAGRTTAIRFS